MIDDILDQTEQRLKIAHTILSELQLFERWRAFGTPILVGAVAYGLAMAADIDMEIYCDVPRIEDGFAILRDCAMHPNVRKARFGNYLDQQDEGLYWRLVYRTADEIDWKIDMWSLRRDHPGPCAAQLVEPLRQALTPETRRAILELKALMQNGSIPHHPSIDIYRAVIDGGVRTSAELETWLELHPRPFLTFWKPGLNNVSSV
ncbi:hypothetical protein [Tengunoibacter tsumagoiensis]|uniref:Nucleotidyltransferase n=1 Tax=Tengunoibacter tsumagoiensis TaxID=2014871 RepID=A0A402A0A0_9CHLR|nr:hypothetical protein [Tengunoibacter tsumagoiensis]GCE12431.1 hypothetical protein KTT_22900 [Tengunoibacter tsumagoiensis]